MFKTHEHLFLVFFFFFYLNRQQEKDDYFNVILQNVKKATWCKPSSDREKKNPSWSDQLAAAKTQAGKPVWPVLG